MCITIISISMLLFNAFSLTYCTVVNAQNSLSQYLGLSNSCIFVVPRACFAMQSFQHHSLLCLPITIQLFSGTTMDRLCTPG
jgi:hypothetical protein